jgi:hypothetical protein
MGTFQDFLWHYPLATGVWFSSSNPVSSINKSDRLDIAEILLIAALNTISQPIPCLQFKIYIF